MTKLKDKKCIPCTGKTPPLPQTDSSSLLKQLAKNWQIVGGHHLEKSYTFNNFVDALSFTNKIGGIAEAEGHHPDIYLAWGKVEVKIWTHKIDGLTESDFVLAAKIEEIPH